uniref:Ubiquitin-like protease family profile domain-containing protein n=1 Tax=Clastoptera arizonana TaxID=38151 RepID=A0A1B6BYT3_9HEMI
MNQQMFHQNSTGMQKADITAEAFRTNYPDISLQPVEKTKTSNTKTLNVVTKSQITDQPKTISKKDLDQFENITDGIVENIIPTQVATVPLLYNPKSVTLVQKSIQVQTIPQQSRLEQNGVIIQPQPVYQQYTRYPATTNGPLIIQQPDIQPIQTVVVSNQPDEAVNNVLVAEEVIPEQPATINYCLKQSGWTPLTSVQGQNKRKAPTVIPSTAAAAMVKGRKSPQKKPQTNIVCKKVDAEKEPLKNIDSPLFSSTKGHVVTTVPNLNKHSNIQQHQLVQLSQQREQQKPFQQKQQDQQKKQIQKQQVHLKKVQQQKLVLKQIHVKQQQIIQRSSSIFTPIEEYVNQGKKITEVIATFDDNISRVLVLNGDQLDIRICDLLESIQDKYGRPKAISLTFKMPQTNNGSDCDEDDDLEIENRLASLEGSSVVDDSLKRSMTQENDEMLEETVESEVTDEPSKEDEEQPEYRSGFIAICNFCGYSSLDFNKCQRCHRRFLSNVRAVPTTLQNNTPKGGKRNKCDNSPGKKAKGNVKRKRFEEPVENFPDNDIGKFTKLLCRTVRIGTYKVVPLDEVRLSSYGIQIYVPALDNTPVTIKVLFSEILRVLICFNKQMPVLFLYTDMTSCKRIKTVLKLEESDQLLYQPSSEVDGLKRITLLPEVLDEDNRTFLKQLFGVQVNGKPMMFEITSKEANELLVKASPIDVQETLEKRNAGLPPQSITKIFIYPPPPVKGGISINTEDYACLAEDQFLNDVIIDFYLKYVVSTQLSDVDQARTHVFSSFFYKRLTTRPPVMTRRSYQQFEDDPNMSAAEKRHSRVKSWTKKVNIFEKDFIIIPINENSHWYLAIICFPGLSGPHKMSDNSPVIKTDVKKENDGLEGEGKDMTSKVFVGKKPYTIGSTTITAVVNNSSTNNTCTAIVQDEEERDEADGDDEDMDSVHSSENEPDEGGKVVNRKIPGLEDEKLEEPDKKQKKSKQEREPIKQPCILIFDSLAGASRAKVVATLRDYVHVEYKVQNKGEERDFSKAVMKGACPRVPQQTNFTDCGLYLLQYVEAFFQAPIKDYYIPIKEIQNWFPTSVVNRKRYEIQQLLHHLMKEQNVTLENLPELNLKDNSEKDHLVDYSCSEDEMGEEEEALDEYEEHGELECGEVPIDEEMTEDEMGEFGDEEMEGEIGEEEMCEDEMVDDEVDYLEKEEICEDEEFDGEMQHDDDIPESFKMDNVSKSVHIQRVKADLSSSLKKHISNDK